MLINIQNKIYKNFLFSAWVLATFYISHLVAESRQSKKSGDMAIEVNKEI